MDEGVHVHDVAWWRGALWAVGSGSSQADWTRGQIDGHLWRSIDRGASFTVAARHSNMGRGDARWVRVLGLADALLLFGYRTDAMGRATIVNARWDGDAAAPLAMADPLRGAFVLETLTLPGGGGFARGAVSVGGALVHRAFRVDADGAARVIEHFNGRRVLDVFRHAPTGEVVVLSADLDEYPAEPLVWSMRAEVTADFERFTELTSVTRDEAVRAVAAWRGRLYFGTDGGAVWRCDLAP